MQGVVFTTLARTPREFAGPVFPRIRVSPVPYRVQLRFGRGSYNKFTVTVERGAYNVLR